MEKAEKRVSSITGHLENLKTASDFLNNLAAYQHDGEERSVTLSIEIVYYFASIMDMAVDTISAELGMLKYDGRPYAEAYVRKSQAGFEFDPITKANLLKDMGKLAAMSPELQLMAEGICNDMRLPLPGVIKERIARKKADRQEPA